MALEDYNGLFVTSTGNVGNDNDVIQCFPSDYSHNYFFSNRVVSVGTIDSEGKRNKFSNYSSFGNRVDIYAHGTVHALTVTKDTNVKIMAIYKKDRSIVFTKTFTI